MENATDALKMAAAVLVFVLALSISINAFGEVRQTSQVIIENRDREYDYSYVLASGTTERIVGAETIIPTIYRAYKENYKIVFDFGNDDYYLYKKSNGQGTEAETRIYSIDLENNSSSDTKNIVLGSDTEKELFLKALLYGPNSLDSSQINRFTRVGVTFNTKSLYSMILEGKKFREELGVYYQEELQDELQGGATSDVPDANKTEKRVITYTKVVI